MEEKEPKVLTTEKVEELAVKACSICFTHDRRDVDQFAITVFKTLVLAEITNVTELNFRELFHG